MREPRLSLVILAVEDRARALRFYRDVFEWPLAVDAPTYAELTLPAGMRLGIYDRRGFGKNFGRELGPAAGELTGTELYVYVADLAETSERIVRAGGRLLDARRERDWGDAVAYFADPDGNIVALAEDVRSESPSGSATAPRA